MISFLLGLTKKDLKEISKSILYSGNTFFTLTTFLTLLGLYHIFRLYGTEHFSELESWQTFDYLTFFNSIIYLFVCFVLYILLEQFKGYPEISLDIKMLQSVDKRYDFTMNVIGVWFSLVVVFHIITLIPGIFHASSLFNNINVLAAINSAKYAFIIYCLSGLLVIYKLTERWKSLKDYIFGVVAETPKSSDIIRYAIEQGWDLGYNVESKNFCFTNKDNNLFNFELPSIEAAPVDVRNKSNDSYNLNIVKRYHEDEVLRNIAVTKISFAINESIAMTKLKIAKTVLSQL